MSASPVTPQRTSRSSFNTPYTPLSLQSFTPTSSTLTTPNSISQSARAKTKRLNFISPNTSIVSDNGFSSSNKKEHKASLSDIANWRSRASEHGIKVAQSHVHEDSHYGDDEASDRAFSDVNDSFVTTEEVLLPPAFLSTHRRPRAQSQALPPTKRLSDMTPLQPRSPNVLRTPARSSRLNNPPPASDSKVTFGHSRAFMQQDMDSSFDRISPKKSSHMSNSYGNENVMCTPPPNQARARSLLAKGSRTDPAVLRRRPGLVETPIRNKHDLSSQSLYNIDENDFEDDSPFEASFNQFEYEQSFEFDPDAFSGSDADEYQTNGPIKSVQDDHFMYSSPAHRLVDTTNFTQAIGLSAPHPYGYNPFPASLPNFQYPSPGPLTSMPLPGSQHVPAMPMQYPAFSFPHHRMMGNHMNIEAAFPPLPLSAMEESFHAQHDRVDPAISSIGSGESNSGSSTENAGETIYPPSQCSVCHRSARESASPVSRKSPPLSLAILSPCQHPLCSGCLTSALNIVGEKDMECAVCKQAVSSFKLINISNETDVHHGSQSSPRLRTVDVNRMPLASTPKKGERTYPRGHSFMDPLFSSPGSVSSAAFGGSLDLGCDLNALAAFNNENEIVFDGVRASTPKSERNAETRNPASDSLPVVLRVDNVPWDITPPAICAWLEQPVMRVHVLLDRKGKTLSHAFVEVSNEKIARAVLRGEGTRTNASGGARMRSSVLGKGKRARGVTVTRSSQEELMRALFPSWRGSFDGCKPSLAGLDNSHVISTLEGGLLTESEIKSLLALVQTPDSHFLKVPSLPFHSLISILCKFPTDIDSRVFWSGNLRDLLFDLTSAAIRTLLTRAASQQKEANDSKKLSELLSEAAIKCQAFTSQQITIFKTLQRPEAGRQIAEMPHATIPTARGQVGHIPAALTDETSPDGQGIELPRADETQTLVPTPAGACDDAPGIPPRLDDLAKEFGVNPQLIEALAQRLSSARC